MELQLTAEQRMIQESAKRMVEREIQPILDAHDPDQPLPKDRMRDILQVLASQGLTSARIPEEAGGAGISAVTQGLMFEMLPPVVALALIGQEATATRIHYDSTPEQRERLLPDLIAARKITCTGSTEPDGGSDARGIKTRVAEDGDHVVLNGRKMWITNASICDLINVTATLGRDGDGKSRMIRIVVDRSESPFEAEEIPVLGLRQGHLGEVAFADCRVPRANVLGREGDAARVLTLSWLVNRPLFGLMAVHMAEAALDAALRYADERTQFGRRIGEFQLVQQLLADIAADVQSSRLLCYWSLSCIDAGERANHASAMAKRRAIAACREAVSKAMEVHGAMGLSREMGLERLYRDIRMLPVPDGTNQILTLIEGRELTGHAAFRG